MTITTQIGPDPVVSDSDRGLRLRIGVILDSLRVPAWVAKVLADLRDSKDFAIAIIAIAAAPRAHAWGVSAFSALSTLLFRAYSWADRRLFQKAGDAWVAVDIASWAEGVPQVVLAADRQTPGHHVPMVGLADDVVRELASAGIDVILDCSSQEIPDNVAATARYGVWSCHEGGRREYVAMPPLVAEMYENHPVSETTVLCRNGACDSARVLCRGVFAVDRNSLCATRNISRWNAGAYMLRRLNELYQHGWTYLSSLETFAADGPCVKKTVRSPGNWITLCLIARLLWRFLGRRVRQLLFEERWGIALRCTKGFASSPPSFEGVRFLGPQEDRSYADPFLLRRDGRTFLFLEEIWHPGGKGTIAYTELDAAGNWHEPQTVLSADYHLSYPFLFAWEDQVYLLPESAAHRRLELYRALDFPGKWALDRVIMHNTRAVDPTIALFEGRYWLFMNLLSPAGQIDQELHLFHAESPLGPWTPHARNPVCADVRRARPAGNLFTWEGKLIRPSQDCSLRYGHAVTWNLVEALTPTEYRERVVGRLEPDWLPGNRCTHTFARDGDLEAIDFRYPLWRKAWRTCFGLRWGWMPPPLPQAKPDEWLTVSLAEAGR
jgi:hypothetical protein